MQGKDSAADRKNKAPPWGESGAETVGYFGSHGEGTEQRREGGDAAVLRFK